MARRRRGEAPVEDQQPTQVDQGGGTQIEVKLKGSADDVTKRLGGQTELPARDAASPEDGGQGPEKDVFVRALRNAKYVIRVKRVTPREFNGSKTNVEVWSAELPLSYQEIQEEVAKTYQGGKYRVAIMDPNSNSVIAADTFEVDGDPLVPEVEMSQEEQDRLFLAGRPKTSSEITAESLERQHLVLTKQAEVERAEAELLDARERRKQSKAPAQDDTRIAELDRRLTEARHQADLEARDRKHADEMRELKAMIAQNARPAKAEGQSEIGLLIQQLANSQAASDKRFEALQKQMQDDKLNAILQKVESMNKPVKSGSLLEDAEAMLKLKKLFGWGGDDDDDDDEDDSDDKRPFWERALDKLTGKFGDKLIAKFTEMEEKGEVVDREKFMREMSQYADQAAAEAISKQQGLPNPVKPPALPAPAAAPAPVRQLPPPPPVGEAPAAQLPPPPPAAPNPPPVQQPAALTIEQEITIRVGTVLDMLDREATFRANEYHWNYEGCWMTLPEDLLEKVAAAVDGAGVVDALTTPLLNPEKLPELKAKLTSNPKTAAWFMIGLNELKEWVAEKQKDPMFDPFSDDGEEEGAPE